MESNQVTKPVEPTFGPFVETCKAFGINRSRAYELADAGLLETFNVGRNRFIKIESLKGLPDRLADAANDAEGAA